MPSWTSPGIHEYTVPSGVSALIIECWGAAGGRNDGTGGMGKGTLSVTEGESFSVVVGGQGEDTRDTTNSASGGYNGGGSAGTSTGTGGTAGGGGSDVRTDTGLSSPDQSLNSRIVVGGGGAGEPDIGSAGNGGGLEGGNGGASATGGTQTSGGQGGIPEDGCTTTNGDDGQFWEGGDASDNGASIDDDFRKRYSGGGGGWYGGGGGAVAEFFDTCRTRAGGGGSAYVDGSLSNAEYETGGQTGDGEVTITEVRAVETPENVEQTITGVDTSEVDWTEPSTGGTPDNYRVQRQTDSGSWTTVDTPTTTGPHTYGSVASAETVRYRVRSEGDFNNSEYVNTQTKRKRSGLSVGSVGETSVGLSWSNVDDNNSYDLLRGTESGSLSVVETITAGSASYTDTSVVEGRQYFYRLRANYPNTDSESPERSATTDLPVTPVGALNVTTVREVTVNWTTADSNPDGDITVEREGAGSVASVAPSESSHTDTGLLDGTEYQYRLVRDTGDSTATSGYVEATTILPAPTGLEVADVRDEEADISWTRNHNTGETRAEVREDDAGEWEENGIVAFDVEQATLTGLLHGQLYGVRVVATTADAETPSYAPDVQAGETLVIASGETHTFAKPHVNSGVVENAGTMQPEDTQT